MNYELTPEKLRERIRDLIFVSAQKFVCLDVCMECCNFGDKECQHENAIGAWQDMIECPQDRLAANSVADLILPLIDAQVKAAVKEVEDKYNYDYMEIIREEGRKAERERIKKLLLDKDWGTMCEDNDDACPSCKRIWQVLSGEKA